MGKRTSLSSKTKSLVEELPINATGKVMKDVLRERVAAP